MFTSNRDEDPKRSASRIVEDKRGETTVYFPQDEEAHRSWIAILTKISLSVYLMVRLSPTNVNRVIP